MYKEIDNIKTYFHNFESIESNKNSVLFIAGAGMDHKFVRALNLSNKEFNPPLVIDLPGHGDSQGSSKNKIEEYSSFLSEALMDFKISNLTICGYSMGGLIALDLILGKKFPAQSLILLNSIAPMMVSSSLVALANKGNSFAADFIIKYGLSKNLIGIKNTFPSNTNQMMFDDLTACRTYQPNEDLFSGIGIPVNIILGGKDRLIDPDQAEVFARNLSAKIYKIDDAGHFPFFENPIELSNIIESLASP
jgi:pimeloyl-ACP methyl ester carboxylesterase